MAAKVLSKHSILTSESGRHFTAMPNNATCYTAHKHCIVMLHTYLQYRLPEQANEPNLFNIHTGNYISKNVRDTNQTWSP